MGGLCGYMECVGGGYVCSCACVAMVLRDAFVLLTASQEVHEGVRRYFEMFGRVISETDLSRLDKIFQSPQ